MGVKEFWRKYLGFRVFILLVISYLIFWGLFMELGLALFVPLAYWYISKHYELKKIYELKKKYEY